MKIPVSDKVKNEARLHMDSVDSLLEFLKGAGVGQMRSSLLLIELMGLSSDQAKLCVMNSHVWKNSAGVESLHERVLSLFGSPEPRSFPFKPR